MKRQYMQLTWSIQEKISVGGWLSVQQFLICCFSLYLYDEFVGSICGFMPPFIFIYNQFSAAALISVSIHSNYAPSPLVLNGSSLTFTTIFQTLLSYASA